MKTGLNLAELIATVREQSAQKRDLIADTKEQVRMIAVDEMPNGVGIVTLAEGAAELERFTVSQTAHEQIAAWLSIPWKYYGRLLADHRDLVLQQVNALFEREPGRRMVRTLGTEVRAFLSDRYRRIDNDAVLAETLPALMRADGTLPANEIIGSHISADSMRVRVLWTDPALEQVIGRTRDGKPDIVKPGFEIGNSETGRGTCKVNGFFYRSFCRNGCVFGLQEAIAFSRTHLGGRVVAGLGMEVFSDETRAKDDAALIAQVTDIMRALGSPEFIERMGDSLRALTTGEKIAMPVKGIEVLAKEVGLRGNEVDSVLENLIRDADYSRWGALNAITAVANRDEVSEERSLELQDLGAQLLTMNLNQWQRITRAGTEVAVRAA